jgi:hypothetical protein
MVLTVLPARLKLPEPTGFDRLRGGLASAGRGQARAATASPDIGYYRGMKHKHSGSCLCGAVRFEVNGEFEQFYLCHCAYCRKDTGSAHGANLFSSSATLRWLAGADKVRQYDLPGTRHSKGFCSLCGSALPKLQENGALLVVPAGSLNTEVPLRPDAHIFVSSRAGWDHDLEQVPSVDKLPG